MNKIKVKPITRAFHQRRPAVNTMLYIEPCRTGPKIEHIVPICNICLARQTDNPTFFDLRIRTIVKRWNTVRTAYHRSNRN